jgi:hypothetical protein
VRRTPGHDGQRRRQRDRSDCLGWRRTRRGCHYRNLAGANATGALAQTGGTISFDGSILRTTSTAANASGQLGLRAIGSGSKVEAINSSILMAPGGISAPANLRGVSAEDGGLLGKVGMRWNG